MASRSEDKLKLLLGNVELPSPSKDFKNEVLMEIQSAESNDRVAETKLKNLLEDHALETASADFTVQVMNKVRGVTSPGAQYPPIISKRAWYAIGVFVMLVLAIALVDGWGDVSVGEPLYFISVGKYLNLLFSRHLESILFSAGACCAAVFLLTVEYWLRKKISNHITMI